MDIKEKLLLKIEKKEMHYRSKLHQFRGVLVEMKKKYLTQKEIAEMLNDSGVPITQQAISQYLTKHPITKNELKEKAVIENIIKDKCSNKKGGKKNIINQKIDLQEWAEGNKENIESEKEVLFDLNKPF